MMVLQRLLLPTLVVGFVVVTVFFADSNSESKMAARCLQEPSVPNVGSVCETALKEADSAHDLELKLQVLERLAALYAPAGAHVDRLDVTENEAEPASPTDFRNTLGELAKAYEQNEQLERSITAWKMLAEQYDGSSRADLWMRGGVKLQLGQVLERSGDIEQAEQYYVESVEEMSAGPEADSSYAALARLINFYISVGDIEEASQTCRKWKQVLDASEIVPSEYCESLEREITEAQSSELD